MDPLRISVHVLELFKQKKLTKNIESVMSFLVENQNEI